MTKGYNCINDQPILGICNRLAAFVTPILRHVSIGVMLKPTTIHIYNVILLRTDVSNSVVMWLFCLQVSIELILYSRNKQINYKYI